MVIIYISLVFIVLGLIFLIMSTRTEKVKASPENSSVLFSRQPSPVLNSQRAKPTESATTVPRNSEAPLQQASQPAPSFSNNEYVYYKKDLSQNPDAASTIESHDSLLQAQNQHSSREEQNLSFNSEHVTPKTEEKVPLHGASAVVENVKDDAKHPQETEAVLFEDKEKSINFVSDFDNVSLQKYNKLSRIGSGALSLADDSLTFRFENKMYKFDFYRLKEVRGDKSAVLLYPDNINYPLLIICPDDEVFASRIIEAFTEFRKGRA